MIDCFHAAHDASDSGAKALDDDSVVSQPLGTKAELPVACDRDPHA